MPEPSIMTVIGFDYGHRKIGVAVGQSLTNTAQPLVVLPQTQGHPDWDAIGALIKEWQPHCLVVGLPLDKDKNLSDSTQGAENFLGALRNRYKLPVYGIDESYSTLAAQARQPKRSKKGQKNTLDAYAAQIIVETWFNEQNNS